MIDNWLLGCLFLNFDLLIVSWGCYILIMDWFWVLGKVNYDCSLGLLYKEVLDGV